NFYQKKAWLPTVSEIKKANKNFSIKDICRLLGYTPQAYHQKIKHTLIRQVNEDLIIQQVHLFRKEQPRCGSRKLLIMLHPFFIKCSISIGRDHFFELLAKNKLLVRKTKRSVHTTNSKHHFRRYPNLIKDFVPLKAHELWVSDITYIPLKNRFAYLFLITDPTAERSLAFM
ncbi:MAG: IS3 family transposase, partial [Gloeobacteraceae cyanobacterium ES-bin-316]|nr:IS3 family transposase [Ferruginibacter sp.]